MNTPKLSSWTALGFFAVTFASVSANAVVIPNTPLVTQVPAKPMVMLTVGKDHKMFYEAYNDASDIDGDGEIDIRFKPTITYYGNFDSGVCYSHTGGATNNDMFRPVATATKPENFSPPRVGVCGAGRWSGNWLNYATTSRMDALRKVLYGGFRDKDEATSTVLRRAYIPQDSHSWAKEYTSNTVDGYSISDYTPFSEPTGGARIFFGNLTANRSTNCSTLNNCSGLPPLLRVRTQVGTTAAPIRVWEWASKERPVLESTLSTGAFPAGTPAEQNFTVRVEVCTPPNFIKDCKNYGTGYKPVGVLHDYGENESMLFGMLTGSYDKHMSGGRLRKVVSSFKGEVKSDGTFDSSKATIVNTMNNIRIRGFNQSSSSSEYWKSSPYADSAKAPTEGQLLDWGNPIGEIMYEVLRYFSGKGAPTSDYMGSTTFDTDVGLGTATWDDPYSSGSAAKAPWCAKASYLVVSDINPSFDSDQLPGSYFSSSFSGDITGLNVEKEADFITEVETAPSGTNPKGLRFIGRSAGLFDAAPSAKNVTSLGSIRGLAPDDPAKQGSYYSAAVASYAHRNDIRPDLKETQVLDTYVVALTSPLPRIAAPLPNGRIITMVPFAKSVAGSGISATKGNYQPTNQIVDFYVDTIANEKLNSNTAINGGRYYAKFRINFEDVEQGGDHDMDAIAEYEVVANADSTLSIRVTPLYQAGGMVQTMGYIVSGTVDPADPTKTLDGIYLVARDETSTLPYFLNVPAGRRPGYCDVTTPPADCATLPNLVGNGPAISGVVPTFTFTAGTSGGASYLKDPLWYAAKWGGFKDTNSNKKADRDTKWDVNKDGMPDTYFLVQNPVKLKEALSRAFEAIAKTDSSASSVIANSTQTSTDSRLYQARFASADWSGELVAYPITGNGVSLTPEWNASTKIPAVNSRKIFIRSSDGNAREFLWSNMTGPDRTALVSNQMLEYLRGVRTNELSKNNGGDLRDRNNPLGSTVESAPLGDLVHSSPFYLKDNETVFVGSNDGMLHAFNGTTGVEQFAFIPSEVVPRLKNLADRGYTHEYFVDGDVVVSPKSLETGAENLLFAKLGRGGKGLFALQVTDPTSFGSSNFRWEYTPAADATAAADPDLGLMLGRPVFAKLNNGQGALIAGNGVNSTAGRAVLYVFLLETSGQISRIVKLDTFAGSDNGLFSPGTFDTDSNGTADFIYAGDLKGNVWKFDLSSTNPDDWKVGLAGTPLFVAKDSSNQPQPITAPISVALNNVSLDPNQGKRYVFFGTGSYFRTGDVADTSTQSWYGIIDEDTPITSRSNLTARNTSSPGTFAGKPVRSFSKASPGDMTGKSGWMIDFTREIGERMVTESVLYRLVVPTLIASSIVPSNADPCIPGGTGYINAINPFTGGSLDVPVFDVNVNKNYTDDLLNGEVVGSIDIGVGLPSRPTLVGDCLGVGGTDSVNRVGCAKVNLGVPALKGRIAWREIIKD